MRDPSSAGGIAEPNLDPELSEAIIDTIREPLVVLTADLVVQRANEVFYETFGLTSAKVVGQRIYDLAGGQWNLPELRDLLENVLPDNQVFENLALENDFPEIGLRSLVLNARRIDHLQLILLAFEDATERKRIADERTRLFAQTVERLNELETLYDTAPVGLGLFDREHRFRRVNRRLAEINGLSVEGQIGRVAWDVLPTLREVARAQGSCAAGRGSGRPARPGGPLRADLWSGSIDPQPLHARRHDW